MAYRLEKDLIGTMKIPEDSYLGIQSLRGIENFPITGTPISHFPEMVNALAFTKKAAALANKELGELKVEIADAISTACDEITNGMLHEFFSSDVLQGGGGTTANMNANEIIANRALELLGHKKGEYQYLHPNIHVNKGQSTNDVYPTAINLALHMKLGVLYNQMESLKEALAEKGEEFSDVIKLGRTELQDAVPMTLGQEFTAYALLVEEDVRQIRNSQDLIREINLGATAIGTGINCHPDYPPLVTQRLQEISGIKVYTAPNLIEATQDCGAFVQMSGVLKRFAVKLSKICNDLRLLSSGPRAGFNEINLPRVQPGSSIMPGKVNPVILDMVNQVCYQVIGADVTITMASEAGQLELNALEPVISFNLFQSISMLSTACKILKKKCITGITANRDVCLDMVHKSLGLATALNPLLGYTKASDIAKKAFETGKSIKDVVLEEKLIEPNELDEILMPEKMLHLERFRKGALTTEYFWRVK